MIVKFGIDERIMDSYVVRTMSGNTKGSSIMRVIRPNIKASFLVLVFSAFLANDWVSFLVILKCERRRMIASKPSTQDKIQKNGSGIKVRQAVENDMTIKVIRKTRIETRNVPKT